MKKSISIELDKTRNMRLDSDALEKIEDKFDRPFHRIDFENMRIKDYKYILYMSLVHEDQDLTLDQVSNILKNSDMDMVDVYKKVSTVVGLALSKKAVEAAEAQERMNPNKI